MKLVRGPFYCLLLCTLLSSLASIAHAAEPAPEEYFLFTSFRGNGESGLYLALSRDGYKWTALNRDQPVLHPEVGANKLMRDPCPAQGPDATFHLVWTTGWTAEGGKVFGYASSTNLIHWSAQRAIEVMQNEPKARNIWAPELFYDKANNQWLLANRILQPNGGTAVSGVWSGQDSAG